jgi:predicted NUDIX family NTP pyrophosphohydrolase
MSARTSAGLLLYRWVPGPDGGAALEVLLGHMGGPFWVRRDRAWTIPKGEYDAATEDPHDAAERELREELGTPAPPPTTPDLELGEVRQTGGKVVVAWAREATLDVTTIASNTVEVEWPPRSGRRITVPELDRAAWLPVAEARDVVVAAQAELLDRLVAAVGR